MRVFQSLLTVISFLLLLVGVLFFSGIPEEYTFRFASPQIFTIHEEHTISSLNSTVTNGRLASLGDVVSVDMRLTPIPEYNHTYEDLFSRHNKTIVCINDVCCREIKLPPVDNVSCTFKIMSVGDYYIYSDFTSNYFLFEVPKPLEEANSKEIIQQTNALQSMDQSQKESNSMARYAFGISILSLFVAIIATYYSYKSFKTTTEKADILITFKNGATKMVLKPNRTMELEFLIGNKSDIYAEEIGGHLHFPPYFEVCLEDRFKNPRQIRNIHKFEEDNLPSIQFNMDHLSKGYCTIVYVKLKTPTEKGNYVVSYCVFGKNIKSVNRMLNIIIA